MKIVGSFPILLMRVKVRPLGLNGCTGVRSEWSSEGAQLKIEKFFELTLFLLNPIRKQCLSRTRYVDSTRNSPGLKVMIDVVDPKQCRIVWDVGKMYNLKE